MNVSNPRIPRLAARLTTLLATLTLLLLNAAPAVVHASPRQTAAPSYAMSTPPVHFVLQPGQEITLPLPLKNYPGAKLHASLSQRSSRTLTQTASPGCSPYITETVWATDVFGITLMKYAITTDYCYDGTTSYWVDNVSENWSSCCTWGMHSHYTRTNGVGSGLASAYGSAEWSAPFQSRVEWAQIDMYGTGYYRGEGAG